MANEELSRRNYLKEGALRGDAFGQYEQLVLGETTVEELWDSGVDALGPSTVDFDFTAYKPPKRPEDVKPGGVILERTRDGLIPVVAIERLPRDDTRPRSEELRTAEKAMFAAVALGCRIAAFSTGGPWRYIDVWSSLRVGLSVFLEGNQDISPVLIHTLRERLSRENPTPPWRELTVLPNMLRLILGWFIPR